VSKNSRNLQRAFSIQMSQPRFRGLTGRARRKAGEAVMRRLERQVDAETQRRLDAEYERQERIRQRAEQAEQAKAARAAQEEQDRQDSNSRCTCRKPTLDRRGKCKRCHKQPAGPVRRRR
jgi:hypothetical protein